MDLTSVITLVFTNNGIFLESGALLLLGFCSVLMGMQDYRISLISLFLGSIVGLVAFYYMGLDTILITYVLFISVILMAFSIFAQRHGGQLMPS